MSEPNDDALVREVRGLLAPGEIDLQGVIVLTEYARDQELAVHDATVEIGDIVAEHAGITEWYVYSGNDDPTFSSNQHQGLGLADDRFVWECQHLLRDGTFDIVLYYETDIEQEHVLADLEAAGYRAIDVGAEDR